MNMDESTIWLDLPPRGPVIWDPGSAPTGRRVGFGPVWSVTLPPALDMAFVPHIGNRSLRHRPVVPGTDASEDGADRQSRNEAHLRAFWANARLTASPDPARPPPVSVAGLVPEKVAANGTLASAAALQAAWRRADAAAAAAHSTDTEAAFERVLRNLAVLDLPSMSVATVTRHPDGLTIRLSETADLSRLTDRMRSGREMDELLITLDPVSQASGPTATALAFARALQIARIVEANCTPLPRLVIETTHSGMDGQWLRVAPGSADWGFSFFRQAVDISEFIAKNKAPPSIANAVWPDRRPVLHRAPPLGSAPAGATIFHPPRPVMWQADGRDGWPRWSYAGNPVLFGPLPADLPFALTDRHRVRATDDEAMTWLMGVEFRLLSEGAPAGEASALIEEIGNLADREPRGDVARQAELLLDWLVATSRRQAMDAATEGPQTALVAIGRAAATGRLFGTQIWSFARHWAGLAVAQDKFEAAFGQACPNGLALRPPRVPLRLSYCSASGLCDDLDREFLVAGRPIADLRQSSRLVGAILQIAALVSGSTFVEGA